MENGPTEFYHLSVEEQFDLQDSQEKAVRETEIISHISKYGEFKPTGIAIVDAIGRINCPCIQCFRDEFIS